jgi:hypothetical protein
MFMRWDRLTEGVDVGAGGVGIESGRNRMMMMDILSVEPASRAIVTKRLAISVNGIDDP